MAFGYKLMLSEKDETVPNGYIPVFNLFTEEKYVPPNYKKSDWMINGRQITIMRRKMYEEIKSRYSLCKSESFTKFWNGNLFAINELGLNSFALLKRFNELSYVMICFEKSVTNPRTKETKKVISWGIKKALFEKYYIAQRESQKSGEPAESLNLYDAHIRHNRNLFKIDKAHYTIETESGINRIIDVPKNAIFNRFDFWCKANQMSTLEGLYYAMNKAVTDYPVEELKELGAYEKSNGIDYTEILIPDAPFEQTVNLKVMFPKSIFNKMQHIVFCYNQDKKNVGKPPMTTAKYIIQAVNLLISKSPLRYVDKDAYRDYVKAQDAMAYNEQMLGNDTNEQE